MTQTCSKTPTTYPFYPQTLILFSELRVPDPPRPSPFHTLSRLPWPRLHNPISDLLIPLLCLQPCIVPCSYKSKFPMYCRPSSNINQVTPHKSWPISYSVQLILQTLTPPLTPNPLRHLWSGTPPDLCLFTQPLTHHHKIQDQVIQGVQHTSWSQVHLSAPTLELCDYQVQSWRPLVRRQRNSSELASILPWCFPLVHIEFNSTLNNLARISTKLAPLSPNPFATSSPI